MWQITLLTFVSIGLVTCDTNCPGFSNYKNDPSLLDELNGELLIVYTSSSYILNCERIAWTVGPNNNKDVEGCCRRIDNFDSTNPEYFEHDITPLSTCSHLQSTERVSKKLVASTGAGLDLCLIIYVCHPSRHGLLVACRRQPIPSLWIVINQTLGLLLNVLAPVPYLKTVNQSSCIFTNNCFFQDV